MDSITQETFMTQQVDHYRALASVARKNATYAESKGFHTSAANFRKIALDYEARAKLAQLGEVK